jgi:glyoxylase-like metal-dependent hydrolase (beta-lactamase superfamily II)
LVDAGIQRPHGQVCLALESLEIDPGHIDTIVLTHTDRDHIGGILDESGEIAFPNARLILLEQVWKHWITPESRAALTALNAWEPEKTQGIWETLAKVQDRVQVVQPEEAFLPGFQLRPACGHRHDHSILKVNTREGLLVHLADTLAHPLFVRKPDWASTYDSDPELAVATRESILSMCARESALVFGPHFPFPGLGHIRAGYTGFSWQPV